MQLVAAMEKGRLFFDGGMGSMLQECGLPEGLLPDVWNIENPTTVRDIHVAYLKAGANLVTTNTFGATEEKLAPYGYSVDDIMKAGIRCAMDAIQEVGKEAFVMADLGPTGKLLKPYGDLEFEDAVSRFVPRAQSAQKYGAHGVLIETMSDLYEMKSAIIAVKEHCDLPIFATLIFDEHGKLLTGGDAKSAIAMLEGLGVTALGVNCGLGPVGLQPVIEELFTYSSLPLICQPNAGLPRTQEGNTVYDLPPEEFADQMEKMADKLSVMGGCCGTTPAYIQAMVKRCENIPVKPVKKKDDLFVSSYCMAVELGKKPTVIGERLNPTGKKKLKQALKDHDIAYVLKEALQQVEAGADILDVNVGMPELDEVSLLSECVQEIQSVVTLPLQIDSSDAKAMERALRYYNGKALINSVNGKEESLNTILPLVQKYGGGLICLTLDDEGIPDTVEGRVKIARKIISRAKEYGIDKREIIVDPLTLPVSAGERNALVTLGAVKAIKEELGVKTVLGVSNVSFGLPRRELMNTAFFTLALQAGLDCAIINPGSEEMMGAYRAFCALYGFDANSEQYIAQFKDTSKQEVVKTENVSSLAFAIEKGLLDEALLLAKQKIDSGEDVLKIINEEMIPALDRVGRAFEEGQLFLPQLLMSAEATKTSFEVLKEAMPSQEGQSAGRVLLATVKGDIHDIGKNIVKVLLESYRFEVLDLGKDVAPETIVETVKREDITLIGLSALMTTTAPYMKETITQLKHEGVACRVFVGGAVITQEYANQIDADFYAKDAMEGVHFAQKHFAAQ